MNIIDVYDIANSTWYKQATTGTPPSIRVNPCSVVFSAPDFSSFQVYLYGGQTLGLPSQQTQYSDLWILTIPSFTWIQVDLSSQSSPPARVGHTCHAWNGQMVVVGGYVGTQISCDSPGMYVFNASSLKWVNTFTALSAAQMQDQQNIVNAGTGLEGSYGYVVPAVVQSVIGGGPYGQATATQPASGPAASGPIATGRAPVFTLTQSGTTVYQTAPGATATSTINPTASPAASTPSSSTTAVATAEPNKGAIIAGVFAGVLAVVAGYLAFCTWLYRRQVTMYKNHVAMSQRASLGVSSSPEGRRYGYGEKLAPVLGAFGTDVSGRSSGGGSHGSSLGEGSGNGGNGLGAGVAKNSFGSGGTGNTGSSSTTPGVVPGGRQHTRYASMTGDGMEYQGAGGVAAGADGPSGWERASTAGSSTEDLLAGQEMSFISVVMSPRRTLRVINQE